MSLYIKTKIFVRIWIESRKM